MSRLQYETAYILPPVTDLAQLKGLARDLQTAEIRSWAATQYHRRRKAKRFTDDAPCEETRKLLARNVPANVSVYSIATKQQHHEARSLRFFGERTGPEWSGWYDHEFWTRLAGQAAMSEPALRHALVSLGSLHESLEAPQPDRRAKLRSMSLQQENEALACLNRDIQRMTLSAVLICYLALSEFSAYISVVNHLRLQVSQFEILDEVHKQADHGPGNIPKIDSQYIKTHLQYLVEKQRSKWGSFMDPIHCLREGSAHMFWTGPSPSMPKVFTSLLQARDVLGSILNYATHATKIDPFFPGRDLLFDRWITKLDEYRNSNISTDEHLHCYKVLRAASKLCFMMIETMHTDDEMIFDWYEADFAGMITTLTDVLSFCRTSTKSTFRFGVDTGILSYMNWIAQNWCRDPTLRRQTISLLKAAEWQEGLEYGKVWAVTAERIMQEEEKDIHPPPKCASDIPRENRLRLQLMYYHFKAGLTQMTMIKNSHKAPNEQETVDLWAPLTPINGDLRAVQENNVGQSLMEPDVRAGRGFIDFLWCRKYYTIKSKRFIFPIPKIFG